MEKTYWRHEFPGRWRHGDHCGTLATWRPLRDAGDIGDDFGDHLGDDFGDHLGDDIGDAVFRKAQSAKKTHSGGWVRPAVRAEMQNIAPISHRKI